MVVENNIETVLINTTRIFCVFSDWLEQTHPGGNFSEHSTSYDLIILDVNEYESEPGATFETTHLLLSPTRSLHFFAVFFARPFGYRGLPWRLLFLAVELPRNLAQNGGQSKDYVTFNRPNFRHVIGLQIELILISPNSDTLRCHLR